MANNINTADIRRSARALLSCADRVDSNVIITIKKSAGIAERAVEGETSVALQQRLEGIHSDARRAYNHLSDAAQALFRYAEEIDRVDREAQRQIDSK